MWARDSVEFKADGFFDKEWIYKTVISGIKLTDYAFLSDRSKIFPFFKDPASNILNSLQEVDLFFDGMFSILLSDAQNASEFYNSYPPKDNSIYILMNDFIWLHGWENVYVWDLEDYRWAQFLKFQYDSYKNIIQKSSFSLRKNDFLITQEKIQQFFLINEINADQEIYTLNNLMLIYDFMKTPDLTQVELDFCEIVLWFIVSVIFSSNLKDVIPNYATLDEVHSACESKELMFYIWFTNHILSCSLLMKQEEWVFEVFERRKMKKEFHDNYSLSHLETFQKSYVYKKYYSEWKIENKYLAKIILDHPDLFIAFKNIPHSKVFQFLLDHQDENFYIKVSLFLQEKKWIKIKDEVWVFLIKNIYQTHQILDSEHLNIALKYFHLWLDNDKILAIDRSTLLRVWEYLWDKKTLLTKLFDDPDYLTKVEKIEFISQVMFDVSFLPDSLWIKEEINKIIEQKDSLSLDDLKLHILTIRIFHWLDEIIAYHKRIFRNSNENIEKKVWFLEKLSSTSLSKTHKKDDIYAEIFSQDIDKIEDICFVVEHLVLPENISVKNFFELCDLIFQKKRYVYELFEKHMLLTLQELENYLDSRKIRHEVLWTLKTVFWNDFSVVSDALWLTSQSLDYEKIYIVLDIVKKIPQELCEDFILYLDILTTQDLRNILEFIVLFKYFRITVSDFQEYIIAENTQEKLDFLKTEITNKILDGIKNPVEWKDVIQTYLDDFDGNKVLEYISSLEKTVEIFHVYNEYDKYILNMYQNGTMEQKIQLVNSIEEFLLDILDFMHPSQTTSTCNLGFWKWSGSYSEVIWNHIFKKLPNISCLGPDDYLRKILSLDFTQMINIGSLSDFNGNHELKCLYLACSKFEWKKSIISFLYELWELITQISGESYMNLTELQKYYQVWLEKSIRKLKRSLGI